MFRRLLACLVSFAVVLAPLGASAAGRGVEVVARLEAARDCECPPGKPDCAGQSNDCQCVAACMTRCGDREPFRAAVAMPLVAFVESPGRPTAEPSGATGRLPDPLFRPPRTSRRS